MNIGYARVSTGLQNLDLQKDSLKKYNCEKIFTDHMSGSKKERPGLKSAIEFSRSGDTIFVWADFITPILCSENGHFMDTLLFLLNFSKSFAFIVH